AGHSMFLGCTTSRGTPQRPGGWTWVLGGVGGHRGRRGAVWPQEASGRPRGPRGPFTLSRGCPGSPGRRTGRVRHDESTRHATGVGSRVEWLAAVSRRLVESGAGGERAAAAVPTWCCLHRNVKTERPKSLPRGKGALRPLCLCRMKVSASLRARWPHPAPTKGNSELVERARL